MSPIDRTIAVAAVVVLTVTSGARLDAQATTEAAPPAKLPKPSADMIAAEQLKSRTFPNVYAAIEALHSNWLRARNLNPPGGTAINAADASTASKTANGSASTGLAAGGTGMPRDAVGIQVYLDGTRLGGIETLKTIPVVTVYSIRRISGTDAQARFGIGHSDGVIFVATDPSKESK